MGYTTSTKVMTLAGMTSAKEGVFDLRGFDGKVPSLEPAERPSELLLCSHCAVLKAMVVVV